ncbi:MAG: hypothetical protein MOGMAGMI_01517 [Candidatus Omnitrophica bacterium]|nr:hypothetical protein [Candidatus Omnitrophota bacterium]
MKTATSCLVGSLLLCLSAAAEEPVLTVPVDGNPLAGRAAFKRLQCSACHRVLGDADLPEPISGVPAPVLGGLNAVRTRQELVLAITRPSHEFAPGFAPAENGLSPMRNFSEVMTVRQLADVVAYLEARQEDPDAEWPKVAPRKE